MGMQIIIESLHTHTPRVRKGIDTARSLLKVLIALKQTFCNKQSDDSDLNSYL